ncbi:MFS transporter [Paenibacillus sp. 481]|uniref:MFS transporter n=1 Tax=Paenibacillus sp. 481 TaxID=2835869 RepID=UPI001E548430|nr:MFS transporter [Paenibacillus sp. 481]UHA74974.1 MFS transporter [Paenibacillus sp. 481]
MLDAQVTISEPTSTSKPAAPTQAQPLTNLWRNKQYVLLFFAYTFALFGNSFHTIALNLWVLNETGSAKMMSVILVCHLVVAALFGSVAGTVVDRFNRRTIMMIADILRCLLVITIAVCVAIPNTPFIFIVILTGLVTFLSLFQGPAFNASLINIVGKEHIQKASGYLNIADNIARIVGYAVGGIFVAAFGGAWAIFIDGMTFLLSFVLIWLAGSFPSPRTNTGSQRKFIDDFRIGFRFVRTNPFAKAVTVLLPFLALCFMSALMLTQVMAVKVWQATPFEFGLIEACIPLGYMIGAGIIVAFGSKIKRRGRLVMFNLLLMGPAYLILSYSSSTITAIPTILLVGFTFSFCTLLVNIILRLEISEELQGRVFGIMGSLISVMPSVGLVVASYFADIYGAGSVMRVIGIILLLFALVAVVKLKEIRNYN